MGVLAVISYSGPAIRVSVTIPVADWCPVSHEPQTGSAIRLGYTPRDRLIDIADLQWTHASPDWPRDLESVAAWLQSRASDALGVPVALSGRFVLANGVILECSI